MLRGILTSLMFLTFMVGVVGCSDTWRGAKQDTGDNLRTTGNAISK